MDITFDAQGHFLLTKQTNLFCVLGLVLAQG